VADSLAERHRLADAFDALRGDEPSDAVYAVRLDRYNAVLDMDRDAGTSREEWIASWHRIRDAERRYLRRATLALAERHAAAVVADAVALTRRAMEVL
jgi:hypothetical protein